MIDPARTPALLFRSIERLVIDNSPPLSIPTLLVIVLLTSLVPIANADDVAPAERRDFYANCFSTCSENQRTSAENAFLMDVPFVLDAYCSCACTRTAMRVTRNQLNTITRLLLEGKDDIPDVIVADLMHESGEICISALLH